MCPSLILAAEAKPPKSPSGFRGGHLKRELPVVERPLLDRRRRVHGRWPDHRAGQGCAVDLDVEPEWRAIPLRDRSLLPVQAAVGVFGWGRAGAEGKEQQEGSRVHRGAPGAFNTCSETPLERSMSMPGARVELARGLPPGGF